MRSMITEAKLTKRFNTGDYEFEEYTLGAAVDEKETGVEVLTELKKQINEAFVGKVEEDQPQAKSGEEKPGKKGKKNGTSKTSVADDEDNGDEDSSEEASGDDGEGDQNDEATDGEDSEDGDDSSDESEEESGSDDADEEGSEDPKPAKSGKGGKEAGPKKRKVKAQNYNRAIEQHKELFSGALRSVSPDWKKSDVTKAKAKKASESLEGKPFLDENGEVLDSFKAEIKKLMSSKK